MGLADPHDSPVVSVVIPCYRQAHFLPDALESVLAQTYPHFEIIVVDDGSPDDTRAVAGRYADVRCLHQRNRGLSAARNAGLAESVGAFVVFLDADDRLTPEALATGVREMAAHPECALVAGDHTLIDEQGSTLPSPAREPVTRDHYQELLKGNFIWCPATAMYRRTIFTEVGVFDRSLRSAEDYDLYLRIARRFPIRTHGEIVAEYRLHRFAMSRNFGRMLMYAVRVLRAQRRLVSGNRVLEAACDSGIRLYQKLYGTPLIKQLPTYLWRGQWRQLVPESFVALWYYPRAFWFYPRAFATDACQRLYRAVVGVFI
jgi:glycosyltransferase involved in cell wall biosynthesis